jgi:uncharacterized protein YdcH (DUF465 family)
MKPPAHLPPHVQRIFAEGDELAQKIARANQFIGSEAFKELPALDAHLLSLQTEVMQSYLHILTIRLARANDAHNGKLPDTATALGAKPGIIRAS